MRKITATLASLSLAAGLSAPTGSAAADGEDIAKIIAGIAALAIISEAIDDRNDRKDTATTSQSGRRIYQELDHGGRPGYRPNTSNRSKSRYIEEPTFGRLIDERRRNAARNNIRIHRLPDRCQRLVETRRGDRLVYGARCLNRNWGYTRWLPESCKVFIDTPRGNRAAYVARCLRRDGWQVARR